jgi:hypothetical protein
MKNYRLLCLILSLAMLFTVIFPLGVFAEDIIDSEEISIDEEYYEEIEQVFDDIIIDEQDIPDNNEKYSEEMIVCDSTEAEEPLSDEESTLSDSAVFYGDSLEITDDPKDVEVSVGDTAEFSVTATGMNLSYQWQYSSNGGESWITTKKLPGALTPTLQVPVTSARIGWKVHCIVTDGNGNSKTSKDAVMRLKDIVQDNVSYTIIENNNLRVVSYTVTASSLIIPSTVNNMTVTEIGEEAFMGNVILESIDLPDTITVIHARAFKNCTNLRAMN